MWHALKYMGLKRLRMCSEFVYKMWGNHKEKVFPNTVMPELKMQ
jgi:hypothetical protein